MQREFTDEVFGKVDSDGVYQPGLLDGESSTDFDVKLESLREEWKERGDGTERVFKWIESRADMMRSKMIASVRRAARLPLITKDSEIPSHFLTNDAESVKKHTQSGFNGTIEAVRRLADIGNEEFSQAIAGVSADYEVREEFSPEVCRTRFPVKTTRRMHTIHSKAQTDKHGVAACGRGTRIIWMDCT